MRKNQRCSIYSTFVILVTVVLQLPSLSLSEYLLNQATQSSTSRSLKEEQHEIHCSRKRSQTAWKILEEYLIPFMEQKKFQLSSKCRLHESNDIFRDQEKHKIHIDTTEWQCGYCKKSFRAENFLDQHFDNRHINLLNASDGKCLADLCGALHCDSVTNSQSRKRKCNPAAAAKNLHMCENLASSCFPVNEGQAAAQLHEFFLRQFCDGHSCSKGRKPFTRGGRKNSSIFYLAVSVLIMMFLPLFYLIVYLYQKELKSGKQLKHIKKRGTKPKPS